MGERMFDALDYLRDRWECDHVWRDQILLAVIVGSIGLFFAWMQSKVAPGIAAA